MKVVIAGCRDYTNTNHVHQVLDSYLNEITEVVCGKAQGVDSLGEHWARLNNIPVKEFPADWKGLGRQAL